MARSLGGLLNNAAWLRGHVHQRLETDDYFSDSDQDSDLDDQQPVQGAPVRRLLQAKTALPQDISFTVPLDDPQTQLGVVVIQGPHGPLTVPLPEGSKPGEQCSVRLGPPAQYHVVVPEGSNAGDSVQFQGSNTEPLTAIVPPGKEAGEQFEVSLPVLLVQVPPGAKPGIELMYEGPDRHQRVARVPKGLCPGHYFPVLIAPPGRDVPVAETTLPQDLTFCAPSSAQPGQPVCVQGPHGPIMVPLPEGVRPGQQCSVRLGPVDDFGSFEVSVPDDAEPGTAVQFTGKNDESLQAIVPEGKKPGDTFQVMMPLIMVRVPPGAVEGTEVMFQTPQEQQVRFTTVPSGCSVGNYFPVLLHPPSNAPPKNEQPEEQSKENENKEKPVEDAQLVVVE